jgi:Zn-dependent protease with chaperone function
MTAATATLAFPGAAALAPADPWHVALSAALPWAVGWLLGLAPEAWFGSRVPMRLSRRRWLALAAWLFTVGGTPLAAGVALATSALPLGSEIQLALLLAHYWVTDGLATQPPHMLGQAGVARPAAEFLHTLRVPGPFLVLVCLGMGIAAGAQALGEGLGAAGGAWESWLLAWPTALYVGLATLLMPVLLRVCWGLRALDSAAAEGIIRDELAANRVSVTKVLAWPEALTGHATAGVIGIVPGFRYLLFANSLAAALGPEEIRSVTAHEAAHLRRRHLWYYLAAVFAAVLLAQALWRLVAVAGLWLGVELPLWSIVALELGVLLVFLRLGWGLLSRHFERQADGHAVRRVGFAPFEGAIAKLARINGIPLEQGNWHHHGIAERLAFLRQAGTEHLALQDRHVARLKLACVGLLGLAAAATVLLDATPLAERAAERYWQRRLEAAGAPTLAELPGLNRLAMSAFRRQDWGGAERYFRQILALTPDDPQVQNNLAWLLVTRPNGNRAGWTEGLELARKASARDRSAYILDTLAEAYAKAKQPELARQAAQDALNQAQAGKGRGEASLRYYQERVRAQSGRGPGQPGGQGPGWRGDPQPGRPAGQGAGQPSGGRFAAGAGA